MKGQAEVTEVLSILGIIVVLVMLIPMIIPILKSTIESTTIDSPQMISKDIAALISVSPASTGEINITYEKASEKPYKVIIKDKMVKVSLERGEKTEESINPILVDVTADIQDFDYIKIKKRVVGGNNLYQVGAND